MGQNFYEFRSNVLILRTFLGYMISKGHIFFLKLILTKNPCIVILVNMSSEDISSRIYSSIPTPLLFLSNL